MKLSRGELWFEKINIMIMLLLCVVMILPFINVIAKSFSQNSLVMAGEVWLYPKGANFDAYKTAIEHKMFFNSFMNTVLITLVGTATSLFAVTTTAYALAQKHLIMRKTFIMFFIFAMVFNCGLIPTFLNIQNLGLYDTLWALIIPQAMNIYFMILVKSFFEQLPKEVEESAQIDGCNELQTLVRIILPMSKPIMATISLFAAVNYWNIYIPGVMFIKTPDHYPMQVVVQMLIFDVMGADATQMANFDESTNFGTETLKMAVIVISTVPILLVYPFLQQYFVKGITLGAVKS